jgi:hypothetical protein
VTIIVRLPESGYGGSAWALNTGEPVEEPQAHRTGDVKDHLADFNLHIAIPSRVHESLPQAI